MRKEGKRSADKGHRERLLSKTGACAVAVVALVNASDAFAVEDVTPYLPGVSIGVPVGALPPPGLYYSNPITNFQQQVRDDRGRNIGVHVVDTVVIQGLTYVPAIPQIFGATYGMFAAQPERFSYLGMPGGSNTDVGIVNSVISPIDLSWNLHNGFFVSVGLTTYIPDTRYRLSDPVHVGRNYFTAEPNLGLSYLKDGWNVTLHPVVDFNTTNAANGLKSGSIFLMDYTVAHDFGRFNIGLGGTLTEQLTNDRINGVAIAASPFNGYGNKARNLTVGPVLGYNFETFSVKAYYNHSVYARNTGAGDNYWLRFDLPLVSSAPAAAARQEKSGPR